jgi:hypothetical protein
LKGILPALQGFQGGEMHFFFQTGFSAELRKNMDLWKENVYVRNWSI